MSQETIEWLNTYTLQSRRVWHTDDKLQEIASTIYDGAIPAADVASRLFDWEPIEASITATAAVLSESGVESIELTDPNRKAICRPPRALGESDDGAILGVFTKQYKPNRYRDSLLADVELILDDDLGIYSAGLLRGGAQAWVQVTVPDTITTPEGVEFRPNLLAVDSLDGSLARTYKRTIGNAVCDNTMAAAIGENTNQFFKVRHTSGSAVKLQAARDALAMVHTIADDFMAEVAALSAVKVSDRQFGRFLDGLVTLKDPSGTDKTGRALTLATNKRDALTTMYKSDPRVAPWAGTAWGVVQLVNTHAHHSQTVRGMGRDERNMALAVKGEFDLIDRGTREQILAIAA